MRTLLALALLAGVAVAQEPPKDDPKSVVERAITAHGGAKALDAFATSSVSGKGTMTAYGAEYAFTTDVVVQLPDKVRAKLETTVGQQKLALVQVVNGDTVTQTTNGKPAAVGPDETRELKQVLVMQQIATLTPLLTDKFTLAAGPADADGLVTVVATPKPADGKPGNPVTLMFDPKTNFLVGHSRDAIAPGETSGVKKVREKNTLSEFKRFDGVMVATKVVSTHDGKPFMTLSVTDAKALPAVEPKTFDPAK
jgi:hypothetical protein